MTRSIVGCLRLRHVLLGGACVLALAGSGFAADGEVPFGLPAVRHPEDNPPTPEKIALGKQLYFDPRLSQDQTVSCASCHAPQKGWSNEDQFATGFQLQKGGRNSPTVINAAYNRFQFWDGRAGSLEEQALGPIQNPIEMAMTLDEAVSRLRKVRGYREQFQAVFGTEVNAEGIAKAIAAYERTILSGNAPIDHYLAGEKDALSPEAERGWLLFKGKAHCTACHSGPNFTDDAFHNIGVGFDAATGETQDKGREAVSGLGGDRGAFKTPTLREIARTGPYMHDGSLATLADVVRHYNQGGIANTWLDEEIFELSLTEQEQADLVRFMTEALASPDYPVHEAPALPE
ncbi:MAG: cytochrome c peroxidase [Planctomycetaceae bacterium]